MMLSLSYVAGARTPADSPADDLYKLTVTVRVETGGVMSAPRFFSDLITVPRLHAGDSLRVLLAIDKEQFVPKPWTEEVQTAWLRLTDEPDHVLDVEMPAGIGVFWYRTINGDTLQATRRGWR